ncbi:MAG TPA: hypothetical protein DDZ88_25125 [Verrucomicrobiales bacterium]|nr:hypothetical protein [Verrucomicrobiales bacterium]
MNTTLQRIRQDVRKLPLEKRHALVRVMESDLAVAESKADQQAVEQAWDAEIASRVGKIKAGQANLLPHAQVEAEMDDFIASLEKK